MQSMCMIVLKKIADDNYNVILYHARMPETTKDEKIKKDFKMVWKGQKRETGASNHCWNAGTRAVN